jgi:glycosyltransferase involved in cell wall biosynthesis
VIKVGIPVLVSGDNWLGGLNYFKSLALSLNTYASDDIEVCFLTNNKSALEGLQGKRVSVIECAELGGLPFLSRAINFATDTNWNLVAAVKDNHIDILTHAVPGRFMRTMAVNWVPDFQHCVLSDIFTEKDKKSRDQWIRKSLIAGHILFSSHSAERDFRRYYPDLAGVKSHVLQFTPTINFDKRNINPFSYLNEKYGVENGYFYLPNQFWKHKNHQVVVDALKLLPADFKVVCSGAIVDYRGAHHIDAIKDTIEKNGLNDRFKMLGVVPREDVYCLLEHALAVLNPSFFEGWSTTVEEAKYSGKRLILSDLDVHKEQNPLDALFFNPNSADDLADKMRMTKDEFNGFREEERSLISKQLYPKASAKFADDYVKIVKKLVNKVS